MKILNFAKRIVRPFVNVSAWMGYEQLKETTKSLADYIKNIFIPQQAQHTETFEEALKRLNLTEEDIKQRAKTFTWMTIFWLVMAIAVLVYGIYIAGYGSWHGFIACIAITLVALAQAFRNNFWLFQIKQKRLGCTFKEWLNAHLSGEQS